MDDRQKNADRFTGFADTYEAARPQPPAYIAEILCSYLQRRPDVVVDLGSGTGLSTFLWQPIARRVIGIEPSDEMRQVALQKAGQTANVTFQPGFSDQTGLEDRIADIVCCSQSFHWMDPDTTLPEIFRILKPGGILAVYDYDWPPVCGWEAEKAYQSPFAEVHRIESGDPRIRNTFFRFEKNRHLERIQNSGLFAYVREIVFVSRERGTAGRMIRIAESQGSLQAILKIQPELIEGPLEEYRRTIRRIYGDTAFPLDFCYRMRLGIKGDTDI